VDLALGGEEPCELDGSARHIAVGNGVPSRGAPHRGHLCAESNTQIVPVFRAVAVSQAIPARLMDYGTRDGISRVERSSVEDVV
jgi:hypothetical protein